MARSAYMARVLFCDNNVAGDAVVMWDTLREITRPAERTPTLVAASWIRTSVSDQFSK